VARSSLDKDRGKGAELKHDLPSWIFDVDDDDTELSLNTPLLQELNIAINQSYLYLTSRV
jgi:hypothetical protein